jgi:hypothetical protein
MQHPFSELLPSAETTRQTSDHVVEEGGNEQQRAYNTRLIKDICDKIASAAKNGSYEVSVVDGNVPQFFHKVLKSKGYQVTYVSGSDMNGNDYYRISWAK